jgi:dephospho-CoA kinase
MSTKPIIGILGGIGSGKSTVSNLLARQGAYVLVADQIAQRVLDQSEITRQISDKFGPDLKAPDGRIDRRKLAEKVFSSQEDLQFLNNLIHPHVLAECEEKITEFQESEDCSMIVLDMPLLLEVGWEKRCDFLVFVECDERKRLERVAKNGKIDQNQLKKREKFQISLDKKCQIAHYIVHNNSDLSDVAEQVAQIFSDIAKSE